MKYQWLNLSLAIKCLLSGALSCVTAPLAVAAEQLVSDASIKIQKDLTSRHHLKNGMSVIVRQIPDSDIVQLGVTFSSGLKDLSPGRKVLNEWLWTALPMAGKGYPKRKVYQLTEQYSLDLACSGGIEYAACGLGTLNEYWPKALPLMAALLTEPSFTPEDVALTRERIEAELKDTPSNPGSYVNEIVNSIFYRPGHPYRLNHDEALKELDGLGRDDLIKLHKEILTADKLHIVVVTSMPAAKVVADLNQAFGGVKASNAPVVEVTAPEFDAAKAYAFYDRELPTAYIRMKMNAPGIHDEDSVAMRLLYEILSEELGEEIRTKRSLSYAVHAFLIEYNIGVGVINVSTSKPEATLAAIQDVLSTVKSKTYSDEELAEFKRGFATSYYLTQETHASLAGALAASEVFYGDFNEYYDMPRRLDKVTPADIKRLANKWLSNLRIGVIAGRQQFKDEWALDLIKQTAAKD
ncbi:MAG: pitrilysin family protein [Proteobacteria bacterium]|nr:pitrilysin family protein [Pseudomonadota bacterium]